MAQPNQPPKDLKHAPSLAQTMYPTLSPQVKAKAEEAQRKRQSLLRELRELNARLGKR